MWRALTPRQVLQRAPPRGDVSGAIGTFGAPPERLRPGRSAPSPTVRAFDPLERARKRFLEPEVEAFAALAKLSYCGPLPGLFSAVALSCSAIRLPGATSSCERASFEVVPGFVRSFQAADLYTPDAIFGYVAGLQRVGDGPSNVESGLVLVIRGSIDNTANSVRDKEVSLVDLENCPGCQVHEGYHREYQKIQAQLDMYLTELNCRPGSCPLHIVGHGSGSDVAAVAAWELAQRNYTIGVSYLFASSMIGNEVFSKKMTRLFSGGMRHGPVFRVVNGRDSAARWPLDERFRQWGIQAHYETSASHKVTGICYAADQSCGINRVAREDLTSADTCKFALAPNGDFCTIKHFASQCWGGLGFQVADRLAMEEAAWLEDHGQVAPAELRQPDDKKAVASHPLFSEGKQAKALAAEKPSRRPEDFYSLASLRAAAALAKLAYCGGTPALGNAVQSTCAGGHGVCAAAGFGVVPDSVVPVVVADRGLPDAYFFYTALARRTARSFAGAPYFVPSESCLLVIRGTANEENMLISNDLAQTALDDPECGDCRVSEGPLRVWRTLFEERVVLALKSSGCSPESTKTATDKVAIIGHSMGGTMATLAMYFLRKRGFNVELSWSIEGSRVGNVAFMDFVNYKAFADAREVPMWHITHWNDGLPRWPHLLGGKPAGRLAYQVHFNSSSAESHAMCITRAEAVPERGCGIFQFPREELMFSMPSAAHCHLPFAPQGNICMFGTPKPRPYSTALQCSAGGALAE